MEEDNDKKFSFETRGKLDLPLLKTTGIKPQHSRMVSQTSVKDPTPGFRTFGQDSASVFPSKTDERELELFSEKLRKFMDKLDSLCLPDRIQFVMKTKVISAEETRREFGIHSMDQSLDLENSFFNSDEFAIDFGGSDLLEFSFKKAEGIKMINRPSKSYVKVDSKALEQFKYKSFAVGFSVEGEARRIGLIKKVSGVFLIMDINEVIIYKIQKVGTWNAGYQKVDILDKDDHIIGSLDLVRLSAINLACTIVFPPESSNLERFLIMGTVYILMWKLPPPKTWLNKFDPSTGSYICYVLKKLVSKCLGRR